MTTTKQTLQAQMTNASTTNLMDYRGSIGILKNQYRKELFLKDATNTAVYEHASVAKLDITNTKNTMTGVNNLAKNSIAAGTKEAQSILDKFTNNVYVDNIQQDISNLNPIKAVNSAIDDSAYFSKSAPFSETINTLNAQIRSDEEKAYIDSRVGTDEPSAYSAYVTDPATGKVIYSNKAPTAFGYADNFKNKEAALNLLKTCIPCDFRRTKFSADFGLPWANTLNDLKAKWNNLKKLLHDLLAFNSGEFSKDFCNLFKFLDGQCIPDIVGLMSLLSLMQLKYTDMSLTSLQNITTQLLTPFLSPIIGSFTTNLDKLSELVLGPLKCVVTAIEFQAYNIQTQINGAINIADKNAEKYYDQQVLFYERKAKALRNRKIKLEQERKTFNETLARTKNIVNPTTENRSGNYAYNRINSKIHTEGTVAGDEKFRSRRSEIDNITNELRQIDEKKAKILENRSRRSPNQKSGVDFSKVTKVTEATKYALNNMERAYQSLLTDLVGAVNDGIGIIKQSIDIYREEFQRLLMGRVTTQEDQIEFTRMLQNIQRLRSIVGAVNDFKKAGWSLKKLCTQGPENALGQIAKQLKNNNTGMFDFYQAQDSDGNPLMVIAPGGAQLTVNGINLDALGEDALTGGATLESITTSVSFNDLDETDKLNREGIVPDLGNIDGKQIELKTGFKEGSELDLHFKTSYAIISNEFCSKSAIDFGSSDTVKQWAANLWQKE